MSIWIEKYRPQSLKDITGHKHIINIFKHYVKTKKIPNIILYGEAGCGKTSSILAMAHDLYKDEFHENVFELNASDERGINVVRTKIHRIAKNKTKSKIGFKLIILDEADFLTKDAQGALRKIMEDYSDKTIFCLMCNYIYNLLPPIKSRCVSFYFKPLLTREIYSTLRKVATTENISITNDQIQQIINKSHGDLRKGLSYLQQFNIHPDLIRTNPINIECIFNKSYTYQQLYEFVDNICQSGYNMLDFVKLIFTYVMKSTIPDDKKYHMINKIVETDKNILLGCNEYLNTLNMVVSIHQII